MRTQYIPAVIAAIGMIGCQCRMEPQAALLPATQVGIVDDNFTQIGDAGPKTKVIHVAAKQAPAEFTPGPVDRKPKSMPKIPPGTHVPKDQPAKGWTHTVIFATPTLKDEDLNAAGFMMKQAFHYTQMFRFVMLAKVTKAPDPTTKQKRYFLYTMGRGMAMQIGGRDVVVSNDKTFGGDVGRFGPRILAENEKILDKELLQVARTYQMMVYDAQAVMLRGKDHKKMILRHAVVVNPHDGQLNAFIWLMTPKHQPAEKVIHMLPNNYREERLLSVDKNEFTFGLPTREAFALVRVSQGRQIPWTADLFRLANQATYTDAQVHELSRKLLDFGARDR